MAEIKVFNIMLNILKMEKKERAKAWWNKMHITVFLEKKYECKQ